MRVNIVEKIGYFQIILQGWELWGIFHMFWDIWQLFEFPLFSPSIWLDYLKAQLLRLFESPITKTKLVRPVKPTIQRPNYSDYLLDQLFRPFNPTVHRPTIHGPITQTIYKTK